MKRDGEPNPYRPPGVSPEPSAEPAAGPRFWKKRPLIGALDGIAVAVLGLVFLNVTIAEPAGGAFSITLRQGDTVMINPDAALTIFFTGLDGTGAPIWAPRP